MSVLKRLLSFSCLLMVCTASAQIKDIPAAFDQISATPAKLYLTNKIKILSGGHLQGIQRLNDSLLVLTGSSADSAYYLIADQHQIRSIHRISGAPFRHAGGCQIAGRDLLVGVEDNQTKMRSAIYRLQLDPAGMETRKEILISRSGTFKRSTAGAVGYAEARGGWLAAVADWDSRNIDFYTALQDSLVSRGTATAPDSVHWCAYQSVNLLMDAAGKLYLIGFGLDGGRDRADLFLVQFGPGKASLQHLKTRYFKCKGAGFRYGAGVYATASGRLEIYTSARNPSSRIAINIFR